ncbi:HAD family hydrolase [Hirschia baltica]|uniref:Haloacid dehalogenase domain protein hydrolase n=1 Tax=Hirschia baltica (strain ATCC 49814 / DSM 5838 / IFAM 1418) TaxID=582402 RepID=C6XS36_HIRBI|nr:HAD family hydrolase [Hirschia baltica]ACT60877.1 Haloacid dehalogenase domain protein hydrolase [Hirschia baltica ATCC 49814]
MNILNEAILDEEPACVLLDLDNTFYAYDDAHAAGTEAAREFAETQLKISRANFDRCFEDARDEIKQRLGKAASSHHRLLYFQRTIEKAGLATQSFAALQMEQAYWGAFLNAASLFPEALEFLDDLRIAGIPTVIVTDLTAQIQHRKILFFGINKFVDWMVTSEEAGADKPDKAIFHLALAKIGGVEGAVWMIGDSPDKDIAGAKNALKGCFTIQKLHEGIQEGLEGDEKPDANFKKFSELRGLIARFR